MKTASYLLLCVITLLCSSSCTTAVGRGWAFASLGADIGKVTVNDNTLDITDLKQSEAFKDGADKIKRTATNTALLGFGGQLLNQSPQIIKSVSP